MRIAYISYEFPPDIGNGGIATYKLQISKLMQQRGHEVEVFAGSLDRTISENYQGVLVHRIHVASVEDFRIKVVSKFSERHKYKPFDFFESPEINGNGYHIKQRFPSLPMVVKIHMPVVLQLRLLNFYTPIFNKLKFVVSNLVKKQTLNLGLWGKHDKNQLSDIDYLTCRDANIITAPSQAMKDWAVKFWRIDEKRIKVVPLPFVPDKNYLNIPIESDTKRVLFIGKLNVHKGLVNLTKAIPIVLEQFPDVKFRFVAGDGSSHIKGKSMKEYMQEHLSKCIDNIEFSGSVPLTEIPNHLRASDMCVFPSIWECFGLVVCESMAAGRVPIFSKIGGMKEIADHNQTGIMINPHKPEEIASAIIHLFKNPEQRYKLAQNARKMILEKYNEDKIGQLNEQVYKRLKQNTKLQLLDSK